MTPFLSGICKAPFATPSASEKVTLASPATESFGFPFKILEMSEQMPAPAANLKSCASADALIKSFSERESLLPSFPFEVNFHTLASLTCDFQKLAFTTVRGF